MIKVTDSAVKHLQTLVREEGNGTQTGLRLLVEKGGCAGMQYGMKLDSPKPDDQVTPLDGVEVMIDPESAAFLKDVSLDFEDSLTGTGFKIVNPNAQRSCGCGTSFEAAPAEKPGSSAIR